MQPPDGAPDGHGGPDKPRAADSIADLMERSSRAALFGMSPNSLLGELFRRRMPAIGTLAEVPAPGDNG